MTSIDTVELSKILFTAFITVFTGVIVLVVGQLLQRFFIEPLNEFSRTVGEIAFALIYYANVYAGTTSHEEILEASKTLRKLAAGLIPSVYAVHGYTFFALLGFVPKKRQVNEATNRLIVLSNSLFHSDFSVVEENRTSVQKLLRIKPLK